MTKCVNKPSNLKSSVYNLTGQNYFEQLTAYNSMCAHLRRVLLAKRVVDTRRPRSERQRSRSQQRVSCKSRSSEFELSNDIIDRLAYDTEHHPIDILKMSWDYKHPHAGNRNNECCRSVCNLRSMDRSRSRIQSDRSCTGRKTPKDCSTQKKSTSPSPQRGKFNDENGKGIKFSRPNTNPPRCCKASPRKWKYEQEGASCEYASSFESSPGASCGGFSSVGNTSPARSADGYGFKEPKSSILRKSASESEEEARYTKFVYDITQEIMHNALYTDKELQNVFRKHLNKNTGILNKGRMMYEIHRLKIALNIPDESDDEEEYESMYSFSNLPAKPPTPPKVLDDNKVMEKLQSYLRLDEYASRRSTGSKNVILVDANPELLVTERDVLMTLVEMDVEPKQAESICKSLLSKSRDTSTSHMVQVEAESCYSKYSRAVDRGSSATRLKESPSQESIIDKDQENTKLIGDRKKCSKWNHVRCHCKDERQSERSRKGHILAPNMQETSVSQKTFQGILSTVSSQGQEIASDESGIKKVIIIDASSSGPTTIAEDDREGDDKENVASPEVTKEEGEVVEEDPEVYSEKDWSSSEGDSISGSKSKASESPKDSTGIPEVDALRSVQKSSESAAGSESAEMEILEMLQGLEENPEVAETIRTRTSNSNLESDQPDSARTIETDEKEPQDPPLLSGNFFKDSSDSELDDPVPSSELDPDTGRENHDNDMHLSPRDA